jgi:hypothetical protein
LAEDDQDQTKPKPEPAKANPDWKDYVAFTLAALQTIALPFILIAILLVVLAWVFTNLP